MPYMEFSTDPDDNLAFEQGHDMPYGLPSDYHDGTIERYAAGTPDRREGSIIEPCDFTPADVDPDSDKPIEGEVVDSPYRIVREEPERLKRLLEVSPPLTDDGIVDRWVDRLVGIEADEWRENPRPELEA